MPLQNCYYEQRRFDTVSWGGKMIIHRVISSLLITVAVLPAVSLQAHAQASLRSQARPGDRGRTSLRTNNLGRFMSMRTSNQRILIPATGLGGLTPISGPRGRNGLPPTVLDGFVRNAGGSVDRIYGGEGEGGGLPRYNEFTPEHRIDRGIVGDRAAGLTTGHGSMLPSAWGGDQKVDTEPDTRSGSPNAGMPANWNLPAAAQNNQRGDMNGDPAPIGSHHSPPPGEPESESGSENTFGFEFDELP